MAPFDDCLTKGRLKKIEPDVNLVARELQTAKEEMERARTSCASGNWNDTAMQSYFVLTRCARAAVHARGYKDTNLYGLQIALEHLFIEPGEVDRAITKQIRDAKDVKDAVYNGRRASPYEARTMLAAAQIFAKFVFTRLALPGLSGEDMPTNIPEPTSNRVDGNTAQPDRQPLAPNMRSPRGPWQGRPGGWTPRPDHPRTEAGPARQGSVGRAAQGDEAGKGEEDQQSDHEVQPDHSRQIDWIRASTRPRLPFWDRRGETPRARRTPRTDDEGKTGGA